MQALRLVEWKHEPELVEVPEPEPAAGQVVVKVGGAGACHSDLHLMHDFAPGLVRWSLPFTLGHENAGWVAAIGAGVNGVEVGQPVAVYGPWGCGRCHRCRRGVENYCETASERPAGGGLGLDGGMAPYLLVPDARLLVPLADLDPAEAAPLTDAALTPYHAIKRSVGILDAGSTAVVIGIGGLGHFAIQIVRHLTPARIIAVDAKPAALALAKQLGADHGVVAGPDAAREIRDLTGGRGAEAVFDLVGVDATLALAAQVARSMGQVTLVGIGGGTYPFGFMGSAYEVSFTATYWGTVTELMEVVALAEAGHLQAHVRRYRLDEAVDAYRALHHGEVEGRAVIVP